MTKAEIVALLQKAQDAFGQWGDLTHEEWVDVDQSMREAIFLISREEVTEDDKAYLRGIRVGRLEGGKVMREAAIAAAERECSWWCRKEVVKAIWNIRMSDGPKKETK